MRKILGEVRRAAEAFEMIHPGDRIAVALSGGKDSMALLEALHRYRYFSPVPFELEAITLDLGFPHMDFTPIADYCQQIGVPYTVEKTQIDPIVFEARQEKNPCALCARMKRGALHDLALKQGCRKVALGHHLDDVVETFFLSLFYEARVNTFLPVTYLDRKGITLIRPLVFTQEKEITFNPVCQSLPVVKSTCPADGNTKREEIKNILKDLKKQLPDLNARVLTAIQNKEQFKLWW